MTQETRSYVELARREKLALLVERGIAPYAYRYERTHTESLVHTAELIAEYLRQP